MGVEELLREETKKSTLLSVLLDPANLSGKEAANVASQAAEGGADIIFVGGSIAAGKRLEEVVIAAKEASGLPVILFPGNVDGVTGSADAILFMSLLNSTNPYWIIQAQALAAPLVRSLGLEAIPTAYLIVEPGGKSAAGWVGSVNEIPRDKPEIAVAYSMAAELLGMRWVYLEAGSGAREPVPERMVAAVRRSTGLGLIVGGGVRSPAQAEARARVGADIIVVGTHVEEGGDVASKVRSLKEAIASVRRDGG